MNWTTTDAALFDLDGVLTPTAEVHMRAWAEMFNAFLSDRGIEQPYTDQDYFDYVDGKPRFDGVRSFLTSRGIDLPEGTHEDAADQDTVGGLGNRKNEAFNAVLARDGVTAYPGSVQLVERLQADGVKMAVVSSSENAPAVLAAAGIERYFPVVVSGKVAKEAGLPGKPAPDTFLYAAQQLGVQPAAAVVLEDALSGVRAGAAGDFQHVIGVDRGAGADALRAAGADVVVADLAELLPADGEGGR